MIEAKPLSRSFTYNGVKLPDPDPRMTAEEVKVLSDFKRHLETTAASEAGGRWWGFDVER